MSKSADEKPRNYLKSAAAGFIVIVVVKIVWPEVIPFGAFELWTPKGSFSDWLWHGFLVLLFAGCTYGIWNILRRAAVGRRDRFTGEDVVIGTVVSAWAGVTEEIAFRWLIFLSAIPGLKLVSFLLCGLPAWFQIHLTGPFVNFLSLGLLSEWLTQPETWAVGAALIASNAFFRDGHQYQGLFGIIASWLFGMLMFWGLFMHGLLFCILFHFLADLMLLALIPYATQKVMDWS